MYEASQPVLPPRPTTRSVPIEPRASGWRSWPILVIAVAMVAIVVAVVLMVLPASGRSDAGTRRTTAPPPAPERMQTAPQIAPPSHGSPQIAPPAQGRQEPPDPQDPQDPWSTGPSAPRAGDPGARTDDPPLGSSSDPLGPPGRPGPPGPPGPIDRTVPGDPDGVGLVDPFASPHPQPVRPRNRHPLALNGTGTVWLAMAEHLCRKILQCGTDDPSARAMCDTLSRRAPDPPRCAAAARCLEHIDTMSCGTQGDDLSQLGSLATQLPDCADAVRC
jgi:hypothetical protein